MAAEGLAGVHQVRGFRMPPSSNGSIVRGVAVAAVTMAENPKGAALVAAAAFAQHDPTDELTVGALAAEAEGECAQ
jgi:hypothetical protein